MPQDEHPGFDHWEVNDAAHPFPVGDITLNYDDKDWTHAEADIALPQAPQDLPKPATVAERSIGVVDSGQLWFGLECTNDPQGRLVCEAVLRGRHVHWFADHGESGVGPVQEVRLSMAEMGGFGRKEQLAAHGPHCDLFSATWHQRQAKVHVELSVIHVRDTVAGFLHERERSRREAERMPPRRPSVIVPELPPETPPPAPPPKPEPLPGGAMAPARPGGLFGGLVALVRRIGKAILG
jgi:hypothetical protein